MTAPLVRPVRRVFALLDGEPRIQTLWLLARLASAPALDLRCVVPQQSPRGRRIGWGSRAARGALASLQRRQDATLQELFDASTTREWWAHRACVLREFPSLEHPHVIPGIAAFDADCIICFGGRLRALVNSLGCEALHVQVGGRGLDDAMNVVMLAIVNQQERWLEATIETSRDMRVWGHIPQIAPGDTGETLLVKIVSALAGGLAENVATEQRHGAAVEQLAARDAQVGARTWYEYLRSARGRRSPFTYRHAVIC
jgi:hypothetical protein